MSLLRVYGRLWLVSLAAFVVFQACGSDKKKTASNDVTVKFKNIDAAPSMVAELKNQSGRRHPANLTTHATQRSFTPVSFKFPVKRITMTGTDMDSVIVYECPGATAAECYVDFEEPDDHAIRCYGESGV